MTETIVILTVKHSSPLPESLTDLVAERTYNYLFAKGVKVDVKATLVPQNRHAWEKSDAPQ